MITNGEGVMVQEQKCPSQKAEFYINDLFELLELKGNNQKMFDQLAKLLMRYPESIIKEAWKEVIYSCNLPNGQLAGTLPKLEIIEKILRSKNINKFELQHKKNKKEIVEKGVFLKLWDIGVSYNRKEITLHELEKKVEQLK